MNNKFKLYTGQTIDYSEGIAFTEKVLNHDIQYKTLEVDFNNLLKAIKSIKYNGVRQTEVKSADDKVILILDYCSIKRNANNEYYLLLAFDSVDEQEYDLCYRLSNNEIKEYEATDEEFKDYYCVELLNLENRMIDLVLTHEDMEVIQEEITSTITTTVWDADGNEEDRTTYFERIFKNIEISYIDTPTKNLFIYRFDIDEKDFMIIYHLMLTFGCESYGMIKFEFYKGFFKNLYRKLKDIKNEHQLSYKYDNDLKRREWFMEDNDGVSE